MERDYLLEHGRPRQAPQSEPLDDTQVANSAGGYAWRVDDWERLTRFLVLGSAGGSYYAAERDLTRENVDGVVACIREDGPRTVAAIVLVSDEGRAPSNDPALYALALCLRHGDDQTKRLAGDALPKVARTSTHLFRFVEYARSMRGFGRSLRRAVRRWYERHDRKDLAHQAVKYRQRDGWTHRDLLRLSHPVSNTNDGVFHFMVTGAVHEFKTVPAIVDGYLLAQRAKTPHETAEALRLYRLPREALRPEHLTDPEPWQMMLETGMPMTALIRNLGNMTRIGALAGSQHRAIVLRQLTDPEKLRKARVHPLHLLVALKTYQSGKGLRGRNTWSPITAVIDALDEAFYLSFQNVEATGVPHLLALDVSGSMDWPTSRILGGALTAREGAAAMALVTLHAEEDVQVIAFTSANSGYSRRSGVTEIGLSRRQRLDDVIRTISHLLAGATDCALPMRYATQERKRFGAFVVYTDNETWAGDVHPKTALDLYRQQEVPRARCAVVGMVANAFSIADPDDRGMLDVVGFDSATPRLIADFAAGRL